MSRYLPDPSIPVAPWPAHVLEAVRDLGGAPLYVVAYPSPGGGWQVSGLVPPGADVEFGCRVGTDEWSAAAVERELKRLGWCSLAGLTRDEWDTLPDGARGSRAFRAGSDDDEW